MRSNKGYYAALCVCLAVLVIGGLTYGMLGNSTPQPKPSEPQPQGQNSSEQPQTALITTVEPVQANQTPSLDVSVAQRQESIDQTSPESKKQETNPSPTQSTTSQSSSVKTQPDKTEPAKKDTANTEETEDAGTMDIEPVFATPLEGKVVMNFSMEHGIYDATLNQYRTNNCVSIAGEKGEKVKAAEDGTVKEVKNDEERGKTVSIIHENGWETTYSQLEDNVLVSKGDKVQKGQAIGTVGDPTKYGTALGTHLDFALIKDGTYVDPKSVLEQ